MSFTYYNQQLYYTDENHPHQAPTPVGYPSATPEPDYSPAAVLYPSPESTPSPYLGIPERLSPFLQDHYNPNSQTRYEREASRLNNPAMSNDEGASDSCSEIDDDELLECFWDWSTSSTRRRRRGSSAAPATYPTTESSSSNASLSSDSHPSNNGCSFCGAHIFNLCSRGCPNARVRLYENLSRYTDDSLYGRDGVDFSEFYRQTNEYIANRRDEDPQDEEEDSSAHTPRALSR